MTTFSSMALYALSLQPPTATQRALVGDFGGIGRQQILAVNGSRLTMYETARKKPIFRALHTEDFFATVRGIASFRFNGFRKDLIVVTSDAGTLVTLEYLAEEKRFARIHHVPFGKSGVRRTIPGQFLAVDPRGRALMVASPEKNKLCWILNRSSNQEELSKLSQLSISSPLEGHKPRTLVFDVVALDVEFDNPVFAALEMEYPDPRGPPAPPADKHLVFYELDLGLNHLVQLRAVATDRSANLLLRLPGGEGFPGGLLCCAQDSVLYYRLDRHGVRRLRVPVPRRRGATEDPFRKRHVVAATTHALKSGVFFALLQTEDGDVFKLEFVAETLRHGGLPLVTEMVLYYFDTIPVASSLCVLKSGFLFCPCEAGDGILYELVRLGDDDDDERFSSHDYAAAAMPAYFVPRALRNLHEVETLPGLGPLVDLHVANLAGEDAPQLYSLSGAGARSSLRVSRNALGVLDLVDSGLPQRAIAVWTTKRTQRDATDALIVLALVTHTLVLGIHEQDEGVQEIFDSGFVKETLTLGVQQFGDDCLVQVHREGIRHVSAAGERTDWHVPQHRTVVACATNNRQAVVGLSSGELYYFAADADGALAKHPDETVLGSPISALALGDVRPGATAVRFVAVGSDDESVRLFSLFEDADGRMLRQIALQGLSSRPTSLCVGDMLDGSARGARTYLHIGLASGVYIRTAVDDVTGELSDTRRRFLGTRPLQLSKVVVEDQPAILALTSRPWLGFADPDTGSLVLRPIKFYALERASQFYGKSFTGIIGIVGQELRIFNVNSILPHLHQEQIALKYTPKKFVCDFATGLHYVIEAENNTLDRRTRRMLLREAQGLPPEPEPQRTVVMRSADDDDDDDYDDDEQSDEDHAPPAKPPNGGAGGGDERKPDAGDEELDPVQFGYPRGRGRWASCVQIVDPVHEKAVLHTLELDKNRCALSVALVTFESQGADLFLAVGMARDLAFEPLRFSVAEVVLYKVAEQRLLYVNKTKLDALPLALAPFKGKLAIGAGRDLGLYDVGMRACLRKAQAKKCTGKQINALQTQGSRLVVGDQREGITYVVHKAATHPERLLPVAADKAPRWTTCTAMVDYDTTAGGDKFGNVWVVRCPAAASAAADDDKDKNGFALVQTRPHLGAAPHRADLMTHYFANDVPMAMQKTNLVLGGDKVLVWAGLQGTVGTLLPVQSRREFKMFQQLELILARDDKSALGRDHLSFRSTFAPAKTTLDGDLLERFLTLPRARRAAMVAQLEGSWTPESVEQRIWNMRSLFAF